MIIEYPDAIQYKHIKKDIHGKKYKLLFVHLFTFCWFGKIYTLTLPDAMLSDGATGVRDLGAIEPGWRGWWAKLMRKIFRTTSTFRTWAWYVHDRLCETGCWDCGTKIPNIVASGILSILLWKDGYYKEAFTWFFGTLFGARDSECYANGIFRVKNG